MNLKEVRKKLSFLFCVCECFDQQLLPELFLVSYLYVTFILVGPTSIFLDRQSKFKGSSVKRKVSNIKIRIYFDK